MPAAIFRARAVARSVGVIGIIVKVVVAVLLILVGLGAYLYFTDYEAKATITEKGKDAEGDYAIVKPSLFPYSHKQRLDAQSAAFVCAGYQVKFTLQTHTVKVFDPSGAKLIYDSTKSPPLQNPDPALRCALAGV